MVGCKNTFSQVEKLPSLREMVNIMADEDFHILDIENLAQTL